MNKSKKVVISLGGSIVVPGEIDTGFIRSFRELILGYVAQGFQFYIIVGGGSVSRSYTKKASEIIALSSDELDWLGIYGTRLNAELIKIIFKDIAYADIVIDPTLPITTDKSVVVGAGWKPGWSTDYVAITLAKTVGAKQVINLSNVDCVYDADPRTNPDAQKILHTTWAEYRTLIPTTWKPGLSSPFDPIASKLAEESSIEVAIINGKKLDAFKNYIAGQAFDGTVIK